MRRAGESLEAISSALKIAKGTASVWLRDLRLSETAKRRLSGNSERGRRKGRQRIATDRAVRQADLAAEATKAVDSVVGNRDRRFWQLCAALLFWCEGSKRPLSTLRFANSDPALISAFLTALRLGFGLDESRFRALVHLHEYHDEAKTMAFWSKLTSIPLAQFHQPYHKPHSGKRQRDGYMGCLSLRYNDANLARKLSALYYAFAQKTIGA
jgi:hypothetical protein